MSTTTSEVLEPRQFIAGEWVAAADGRTFDDIDPFTGDVVARVPAGTAADARAAIDAAAAAFTEWSQTPPAVRQGIFLRAADILESRMDEVVGLLARETGASFGFGMFQMHFVPGLFRQAAGSAYAPTGEILPSDIPGAFAMGVRRPVGVVGAIAPWNAALILSARSIAAPLVLGNTVVLKPSENSPIVGGLIWGEIFEAAGLPPGVLNIVTHGPGEAVPIGDELVSNPHVRRINFTGSTGTGRKLAEAAGRHLKRVVLELGGQNPLVVLRDADLEYAVNATAFGAFLHQGQICMSTRKIIVERPIADEFIERLVAKTESYKVGDPREHDTIIGPLITPEALGRREGPRRRSGRGGRPGAHRRSDGRRVLPADAARRRAGRLRFRPQRDVRPGRVDRGRRQRRRGRPRGQRHRVRPLGGRAHERSRGGHGHRAADQRRHRPRQRPDGRRRAADAVRRRQGQRLGPLRRHRRGARVHRAPLDHRAGRHEALPLLDAMAELLPLPEAIAALVHDGDTVALEGFTHLIPHAAGHEIVRQGRTGLTLVRMTPDVIYDQMIGMGCARKLVFSWGGNPGVGSLHRFREAVERDWPAPLELDEQSHAGMAAAYAAGAANLPFGVLRGYAGTDLGRQGAVQVDHVPVHRRATGRDPRAAARCRDHPRAAGRRGGQRPDLGHHGRAEGGRPGLAALARDGRGDRAAARSSGPAGSCCPRRPSRPLRSLPAVRTPRTPTASTTATTRSTSPGMRSAAIARRSPPGCGATCSTRATARSTCAAWVDAEVPAG